MADNIVNLNKARKDRDKAQRSAKAAENRALFGQTKGQKAQTMSLAEKVKQVLDAAKRDRKD
jgi:adenylosuccinate lyase